MPLYYLLVGRMESVLGVHEYWPGFDRSISGCVLCMPVRYHYAIHTPAYINMNYTIEKKIMKAFSQIRH